MIRPDRDRRDHRDRRDPRTTPPWPVLALFVLAVVAALLIQVLPAGAAVTPHGMVDAYYVPPDPVTPDPPDPGPQSQPISDVWLRLAECESHGEWDYNEHSGWGSGIYDGGLQFDPGTWLAFGGGQYAPTADLATPTQQVAVAELVLAAQGWRAWPACSRALGYR